MQVKQLLIKMTLMLEEGGQQAKKEENIKRVR